VQSVELHYSHCADSEAAIHFFLEGLELRNQIKVHRKRLPALINCLLDLARLQRKLFPNPLQRFLFAYISTLELAPRRRQDHKVQGRRGKRSERADVPVEEYIAKIQYEGSTV
jgi:hypothetical protein